MHWSKKSVIKVQFVVMSKCQAKGQKRKSGEQEMDWCLVFFSTIVKVHVTVTVITVKCMLFAVVNVKVLHSSQSVIELFSLVQKKQSQHILSIWLDTPLVDISFGGLFPSAVVKVDHGATWG